MERPTPLSVFEGQYMEVCTVNNLKQKHLENILGRLAIYFMVSVSVKESEESGFWIFRKYDSVTFKVYGDKIDVEDFVDMLCEKEMEGWD